MPQFCLYFNVECTLNILYSIITGEKVIDKENMYMPCVIITVHWLYNPFCYVISKKKKEKRQV